MAAGGQGDIYRLLMEFNGKLGDIGATVRALNDKVDQMADEMHLSEGKSDTSRASVHRRLDEVVARSGQFESEMVGFKSQLAGVTSKIEGMEKVTVEVTTLRTKAEGAGTLGRLLLRAGIVIVSFAGWAVGLYTWLTGRPPP
jgi:hypothetical protein